MTAEMKSKPVWVWLPGETEPVRCGTFSWRVGLGQFVYDRDYLCGGDALALDPVRIPLSQSRADEAESTVILDPLLSRFAKDDLHISAMRKNMCKGG